MDRNWQFSIPPPHVNTSETGASWEGLDNAAWGSHVYYELVKAHRKKRRGRHSGHGSLPLPSDQLPLALSKFAAPDWRDAGRDPRDAAESPAHHRFPVWWTGDMVTIQPAVESMVDAGVHALKPYVHSDCGGDWYDTAVSSGPASLQGLTSPPCVPRVWPRAPVKSPS